MSKKLFIVFLVLGLIGCEGQSPEEFQKLQNDIFNKIVSLPDNQACKKISEFEAWMKTIDARSKQDSTYWRVVAENYKALLLHWLLDWYLKYWLRQNETNC